MKLLLIALTVFSSFFAQAKDPQEIAPDAIKSFQRTFSGASEVTWTLTENMYKVNFQVAGQYATAYYDNSGTLLVITRNISPLQLPVVLLAAIKKDYAQQWISDVVEVSNEEGTHYYVSLEDGHQKITLKSETAVKWMRYQKLDK